MTHLAPITYHSWAQGCLHSSPVRIWVRTPLILFMVYTSYSSAQTTKHRTECLSALHGYPSKSFPIRHSSISLPSTIDAFDLFYLDTSSVVKQTTKKHSAHFCQFIYNFVYKPYISERSIPSTKMFQNLYSSCIHCTEISASEEEMGHAKSAINKQMNQPINQ